MHSQKPPGVVQNWTTLQCSKHDIEQCGYDHAPVTRGRMRTQFPLPHGPFPRHGTDEDKGAGPPRWTAQVCLPFERLVGGALCRAEPSMTRKGRGPVAKPPVVGPAADARRGSQTALSKPPTGRCREPLVGTQSDRSGRVLSQIAQGGCSVRSLREGTQSDRSGRVLSQIAQGGYSVRSLREGTQSDRSGRVCPMPGGTLHYWWLARPAGEAREEASQGAAPPEVACSVRRPRHGARTRGRSTRGRGMGGTGEGDTAATPPPPQPAWGHQPAPCLKHGNTATNKPKSCRIAQIVAEGLKASRQ